jgi:SAM-dependent methyltransferase
MMTPGKTIRTGRDSSLRDDDRVTESEGNYRLYRELADWWPLLSPVEEYAADAAVLERVFSSAPGPVRTILDLGSGGGHVATYLARQFTLTLVDLSAEMLAVSRELNPGCEHIRGDMLTLRLRRTFDAVLVHDAVDYVITEQDLVKAVRTAFVHCRPGGMAVFAPDHVADTFRPGKGGGGTSDDAGNQASFRERTTDPDPADEWIECEYEFTLRSADGVEQVVRETHRLSAFRESTWMRVLHGAGFEPEPGNIAQRYAGPAAEGLQNLFVGHRPAGNVGTRG